MDGNSWKSCIYSSSTLQTGSNMGAEHIILYVAVFQAQMWHNLPQAHVIHVFQHFFSDYKYSTDKSNNGDYSRQTGWMLWFVFIKLCRSYQLLLMVNMQIAAINFMNTTAHILRNTIFLCVTPILYSHASSSFHIRMTIRTVWSVQTHKTPFYGHVCRYEL